MQLRRDFRGRCKARQQGQGFGDVEGVVRIEPQACFSMNKAEAGWCASLVMSNTVVAAGKRSVDSVRCAGAGTDAV